MYSVGLRIIVMFIGNLPMYFLLTIVPFFAWHQGCVTAPDILLSDMMASTPLLRSLYATGICLVCTTLVITSSELIHSMKVHTVDPEARRAMDQLLVTVWCVCSCEFRVLPATAPPPLGGTLNCVPAHDPTLSALPSACALQCVPNALCNDAHRMIPHLTEAGSDSDCACTA